MLEPKAKGHSLRDYFLLFPNDCWTQAEAEQCVEKPIQKEVHKTWLVEIKTDWASIISEGQKQFWKQPLGNKTLLDFEQFYIQKYHINF